DLQLVPGSSMVALMVEVRDPQLWWPKDRKSTRLNSSHVKISYAVFCLKKKTSLKAMHVGLGLSQMGLCLSSHLLWVVPSRLSDLLLICQIKLLINKFISVVFFFMCCCTLSSSLFPYATLFRSPTCSLFPAARWLP